MKTGYMYWLASPFRFDDIGASGMVVYTAGYIINYSGNAGGVRPVVSLKPGTEYTSGNGAYTNPFVVE